MIIVRLLKKCIDESGQLPERNDGHLASVVAGEGYRIETFLGKPICFFSSLATIEKAQASKYHCDEKKIGLEQFPWIRTIFMFLDPN